MAITGQFVSSGDLDRTIQILSSTVTRGNLGQEIKSLIVTQTLPARRANLVRSDYARAEVMSEVASVRYDVRYVDGIEPGMRLSEDGTDYTIISVEKVDRRKGLIILCKAVV